MRRGDLLTVRAFAFVLDCKDLPVNIMYSKDLAAREALGFMGKPSDRHVDHTQLASWADEQSDSSEECPK